MARWLVATFAAAGSVLLLGLFAHLMRENQAKNRQREGQREDTPSTRHGTPVRTNGAAPSSAAPETDSGSDDEPPSALLPLPEAPLVEAAAASPAHGGSSDAAARGTPPESSCGPAAAAQPGQPQQPLAADARPGLVRSSTLPSVLEPEVGAAAAPERAPAAAPAPSRLSQASVAGAAGPGAADACHSPTVRAPSGGAARGGRRRLMLRGADGGEPPPGHPVEGQAAGPAGPRACSPQQQEQRQLEQRQQQQRVVDGQADMQAPYQRTLPSSGSGSDLSGAVGRGPGAPGAANDAATTGKRQQSAQAQAPLAAHDTVRSLALAADATPKAPGSGAVVKAAAAAVLAGSSPEGAHWNPLAGPRLELSVLSGPAAGASFSAGAGTTEVVIGRHPGCSACIPDPEISSRHAVLAWSPADQLWTLMDSGSLNGTTVNGTSIGREGRQPGDRVPLGDGDALAFGSVTSCRLRCQPSVGATHPRHASGRADGAAAKPVGSSAGANSGGSCAPAPPSSESGGPGSAKTQLPPPQEFRFQCCGVEGAVLQRVGAEHRRAGTGSEDVAVWEAPLRGHARAGMFCIFDGHHGRSTAEEAAALLPAQLLLQLPGDGACLLGGPASAGAALEAAFLEADRRLTSDEGCTATVILVETVDASSGGSSSSNGGGGGGGGGDRGPSGRAADGSSRSNGAEAATSPVGGSSTPPAAAVDGGRAGDGPAAACSSDGAVTDGGGAAVDVKGGSSSSGSSASSGVALQVANVGDSEAILVDLRSGGALWRRLTEDHRIASNPSEQARLAARSGQAVTSRLYGLNLSRMLGDRFLKEEGLGFTARPHVCDRLLLTPGSDSAVVAASDGLWDVTSCERAAQIAARALGAAEGGAGGAAASGAAAAAEALVAHALQQRSKDDVSVMVLRISI